MSIDAATNTASNDIETDVVVLGMGPGGEVVASALAEEGLDVVGVDHRLVGGECAYWGCVPSKMMLRAAELTAEARRADELSGDVTVEPNWDVVARRIREEATDDWDDSAAVEAFEQRGGTFVRGRGAIMGRGLVEAADRQIRARRGIVIATGTAPAVPPIEGLDDTPFWTNREAIETTEVPASLVVLGGGAIGCELAQVFAGFGARVTMIESEDRLQSNEEPEASAIVQRAFERDGIIVRVGRRAEHVSHAGGRFSIRLDDDATLDADQLLVVAGRSTDLEALGVASVGIDADAKFLSVDGSMQVTEGIWAIGDITGVAMFTHVARYQADIAIAAILGRDHEPATYHAVPHVTFTDPELAAVGLTEAQARDQGLTVATGCNDGSARAWLTDRSDDVLVKLVADRDRNVLVGATVVGPSGGEVLGLLVLAVHAEVPVARLRSMIYAYPTYHRAIDDAVKDLDS